MNIKMAALMNDEDSQVAGFVKLCLEEITAVIDLISNRVNKDGRVVYIGAGTSGR